MSITTQKALIDELGKLHARQSKRDQQYEAQSAKDLARIGAIEEAVLLRFRDLPAEESASACGAKWVASISARGNQSRIIDVAKAIERVGVEHATILLGKLRALLPKHEQDEFIKTGRTGPRSIALAPKAGMTKAA